MSVAVACNLSDGVILGVDSAVTVPDNRGGVIKVYENAPKLFQLGDFKIGIATYGLASFENRTIGSYISEFESTELKKFDKLNYSVKEISESLRLFFINVYSKIIIPQIEKNFGKRFSEIPPENITALGLIVAGFSSGSYLSEVWNVIIPHSNSATLTRGMGHFGSNWFATFEPIRRYIKGFDPTLLDEVITYLVSLTPNQNLSEEQKRDIQNIVAKHEYIIPFGAMPIQEGIEYTKFLVQLVISHHRFAVGAPVVGGKIKIGKVTYTDEKFCIQQNEH